MSKREAEKHEVRQVAKIRMLRQALNASLDLIEELERDLADAWDKLREHAPVTP